VTYNHRASHASMCFDKGLHRRVPRGLHLRGRAGCCTSTLTSAWTAAPGEPVCPVEAIYYEDDVPERVEGNIRKINADFFEDLGSPGGASKRRQDRQRITRSWRQLPPQGRGRGDPSPHGLPEYPWDELAPIAREGTSLPPGGAGRPVGRHGRSTRCPRSSRRRSAGAANAPRVPAGPQVPRGCARPAAGLAIAVHSASMWTRVTVLPVIGTKEFIAWLPTVLGLGFRRHGAPPRPGLPHL